MRTFFVTSTGTGAGKTYVTRALARALARRGRRVAALKPLETGVVPPPDGPGPADAVAIARAAGRPELASAPGQYRARLPAAPYAATLAGEPAPPDVPDLARAVRDAARRVDATHLLVEGAGGLFVPLDGARTIADLVVALGTPCLVVVPDVLGTLSHTLALVKAAWTESIDIDTVVVARHGALDPAVAANTQILAERLALPVLPFAPCPDDDDALADEAERSGLLARVE
jgi:dethiobiotin synthetase